MRMRRRTIIVGTSLTFVALLALVLYVKLTFKINFKPLTEAEKAQFTLIGKQIERLAQSARTGEIPWRRLDFSSVGSPEREAQLLQLRRAIDVYSLSHSQPAVRIEGMSSWLRAPQKYAYQKRVYEALRECQILNLQVDSYILNCDGWVAPASPQLPELVGTFDRETEKFYLIEGHTILFVPPPVSGKPFQPQATD
jgi:hypothetical protein